MNVLISDAIRLLYLLMCIPYAIFIVIAVLFRHQCLRVIHHIYQCVCLVGKSEREGCKRRKYSVIIYE